LQEIFRLFIGIFNDLGDTKSPFLPRRMKILENAAALKFYVILLDIGCEGLVLELFKTFFSVSRQVLLKTRDIQMVSNIAGLPISLVNPIMNCEATLSQFKSICLN
jgi:hypothetical protein